MEIGTIIMNKRKALGYTQQALAEKLHVSFQAVSKWENGTNCPEIELLPALADVLDTSIDALMGYQPGTNRDYEDRYNSEDYYWGIRPNSMCYEIMELMPPSKPLKVLDMGCGEGKDAVFLARNGYVVSAFDITESGIEKGKLLAEKCGVKVNFFRADIDDYRPEEDFDIIFSSGVFHFIDPKVRGELIQSMKEHTVPGGINAINAFVKKPFIETPPDKADGESDRNYWKSGELFMHYTDWRFERFDEVIFDCNSGGIPHQHCMDIMIARKQE